MSQIPTDPAQRAIGASAAALAAAGACLALLLVDETIDSLVRTVFVSMGLGVAALLHFAFLAIAARRSRRSMLGWTGLAVLLPFVGGVVALVLLSWYRDEDAPAVRA